MANLPHEDRVVNLYEFALEWGLPFPAFGEEWELECLSGSRLAHNERRAVLIYMEMRCGHCWECRVMECRRMVGEESALLDIVQDQRGPGFVFDTCRADWNSRFRQRLLRAKAGWRVIGGHDGLMIGYANLAGAQTLDEPRELVRPGQLVAFIAKNASSFLHSLLVEKEEQSLVVEEEDLSTSFLELNATKLDPRIIRRQFGGSFKGIYLRKPSGAKLLKPSCTLNHFFQVAEDHHAEVLDGQTPWGTRGVWARFQNAEVSTAAALACINRAG